MRFYSALFTASVLFTCGLSLPGCKPTDGTSSDARKIENRHELSKAEQMERLRKAFNWDRFVSNEYLPTEIDSSERSPHSDSPDLKKITVGLPWLQNDQTPALWLGLSRGYFREEGLDIEIAQGGPGRDNLLFLLSGQVDITIASCATGIIRVLASETGGEIVAVGALQKAYPYAYIGLDKNTPSDQASSRIPTAEDFRGSTLGMTPGGETFLAFALDVMGLDSDDIKVRKAGSGLIPLTSGVYDFYTTMSDNNPRRLEAMGFKNWMLWEFKEHGWEDYHNVISVLPRTLESDPESVRAFLRALDRSLRELLDGTPIEIAKEILPYVEETGLTPELIALRLERQRPITTATDDEPLLHMTTSRWVEAAAILWRLGVIDLPHDASAQ